MNICVVGSGYVGLVTGAVFADLGNEVVCVDNVAEKIAALQAGGMPIYEPGLEEMVARNVADGRLSFTTDLAAAVRRSVIVFIAVGTPPKDDGRTDLGAVEAVAREIGRAMERYTVVVNKSTVPVGTGEFVREVIERHQPRPVSLAGVPTVMKTMTERRTPAARSVLKVSRPSVTLRATISSRPGS